MYSYTQQLPTSYIMVIQCNCFFSFTVVSGYRGLWPMPHNYKERHQCLNMLAKMYNGLSLEFSNIKITQFAKNEDPLNMTSIEKKIIQDKEKITTQDTKKNSEASSSHRLSKKPANQATYVYLSKLMDLVLYMCTNTQLINYTIIKYGST